MIMKIQAFLSAVGLILGLNGMCVEASGTMFVFGDSFVDSGNLPQTPILAETTRQWHYPYGISYHKEDGSGAHANATGRFSDFMVESDFVARMMGLPMSPPTYQSTHDDYCDPSGMNFAFAGTGVFEGMSLWIDLREQVDQFVSMIESGIISINHVTHSVALLGSSGNDHRHFTGQSNSWDYLIVAAFAGNMTTEIAANVERLQNIGVKKVLVNNLHPLGCTPSICRASNYKVCDDMLSEAASVHNSYLEQKLGNKKDVFIVDLHTAFESIIGHGKHDPAEDSESYRQFKHKREPCCESSYPNGFCGQRDDNSNKPFYSLCADPGEYFFWDDANPTHAGWEAVMAQLNDPIKHFLELV